MFGLLNINKPPGITSRRVVDRVQPLVGSQRIGHAGTLDPLATGVLILCVGQATRLIEYVQRMPKRYVATFLLGHDSPTEDIEGEVVQLDRPPVPSIDAIRQAALHLVGTIQQRPPAFSALKVKGRRAYDLARKGDIVKLAPREVTVYELQVVDYDYPRLTVQIGCSSGTYVRALGRDLAVGLGTAAVMSELTRTAIGDFRLADACELDKLTADNLAEHLLPADHAVRNLPFITLSASETEEVINGRRIHRRTATSVPTGEVAALAPDGRLLAILAHRDAGQLAPVRVFTSS